MSVAAYQYGLPWMRPGSFIMLHLALWHGQEALSLSACQPPSSAEGNAMQSRSGEQEQEGSKVPI